ncbi:pur operon repressor [Bacillaceae bacterium S4-13-58]
MKRSGRLVAMTHYLLDRPHSLVSLPYFSEKFHSAKSSISEDLAIIDEKFQEMGIGYLETISGARGGVKYIPKVQQTDSNEFAEWLCQRLEEQERLLPGGYLFMSDLLGKPDVVKKIGRLFASQMEGKPVDYVMTVATKGIPLAYGVAGFLNVPVVIVRRDPKVTEGSTVSINYVSGSSRKIQTMVLPKRSLKEGANVFIVDDFMKAGGTINGMKSLLNEFNATVAGIGVLVEAEDEDEDRVVDEYTSILKVKKVDEKNRSIEMQKGNYFDK